MRRAKRVAWKVAWKVALSALENLVDLDALLHECKTALSVAAYTASKVASKVNRGNLEGRRFVPLKFNTYERVLHVQFTDVAFTCRRSAVIM